MVTQQRRGSRPRGVLALLAKIQQIGDALAQTGWTSHHADGAMCLILLLIMIVRHLHKVNELPSV